MKVTSKTSVSFPKLDWAISAGEEKELPEGKEAQERVLSDPNIEVLETKSKSQERRETIMKEDEKK